MCHDLFQPVMVQEPFAAQEDAVLVSAQVPTSAIRWIVVSMYVLS